ncbi:winged helix DNA-binding domain-containing protein [Nocardioides ferulae]|uniref:winged helix DNA-binding domain-containing protein n=1 Tax=Nocardioides ferulae TaxID=2340821 RepID=UPI0013DE1302|nr:winged helix DNA-binding domain-containing protein [Nocardioides ferulae]
MTTDREIARWRLHNQRLVAPHANTAAEVVSGLLAVQAENPSQSAWAVACRTGSRSAADLDALLDSGEVLRTHVLRSTWHYVAAADADWLLEVTAPRVRPVAERGLTDGHGWSADDIDRGLAAVVEALSARPHQTRDQLAESLREAGQDLPGHALMMLMAYAELDRVVISGRPDRGAHTYALYADRVGVPGSRPRDEALAELALRYFTGHGPATVKDLAYWATLPVTDVRRGLAQVRERLESFEHGGRTFWHAPGEAPPAAPQQPVAHLLQILDETYRGYQDSRMVLDADSVVPRGRETSIGMALVDAQMVAAMKRTVGSRVRFDLAPYRPLGRGELAALEEAGAAYAEFLGLEHELRVGS